MKQNDGNQVDENSENQNLEGLISHNVSFDI